MSESTTVHGSGSGSSAAAGGTAPGGRTKKAKRYTSERSRAEAKLGLMLAAPAAIVLLLVTAWRIG